jgi:DNA invertase Pin-like site-specific DNA recombinase
MATRAPQRGLFYTRDSGGEHENTPGGYVGWAQHAAREHGVRFAGTPEQIERMIRTGVWREGDVFLDYCVKGNLLTRRALDALIQTAEADRTVSHVFFPSRDRLARPDDPFDGVQIEDGLRQRGITLVFMSRVLRPLGHGRRDMGEMILSLIDYDKAGQERRDLAQKMLYAQLKLARGGYSTGGRAPYGFCRWQVREDGTPVRRLSDGEVVKMAGHHVVWLPVKDEGVWATIRRILDLLESTPASRVAAQLTKEKVPPPDAGRQRTDRGVRHATSGVWHQVTVTNIARNPLLRAVVEYGRRSMGDTLRFNQVQPREMTDDDFREDGKPKVVRNPEADRITAPAQFVPPVEPRQVERAIAALDRRAGTQRGKPRSQNSDQNPLGCRVFDCACGWPMYRQPYNGSFRYACGLYQQSHGAKCAHNTVDGVKATRFLLACVRQRVLAPGFRDRLRRRLEERARAEQTEARPAQGAGALEASLAEVRGKLGLAEQNMALAATRDQFRAVSKVFDQLQEQERALEGQLRTTRQEAEAERDTTGADADAVLAVLDRLAPLAEEPENLGAVGTLFTRLNARMFFRFAPAKWGKRPVRRVSGGVVTFGATPAPIKLYDGPTGRRALSGSPELQAPGTAGGGEEIQESQVPGREGDSFGKVSRADWI